jgi:exosortase A
MSDGTIGQHLRDLPEDHATTAWAWHLGLLAAALALLGACFAADIGAAVNVWWAYPAYSHCFLILPITLWLIWEKRDSLKGELPTFSPLALAASIPILLLWSVGEFASITEARQFACVGLAECFIVALLGWRIFRKIAFPCLYLLFLVPTGQYLIPALQDVTAKFVEWGLNAAAIPYFRDGLVFELVNGRYEIAEACAGLRFLIATVALGVLFAYLSYRKPAKIVLFLLSCLIFPVIGNGIRALLTVMVANYTNNRVAAGFDHIVYGWVFAVAIIMVILFVGSKFRDPEAETPPASLVRAARRFSAGGLAGALGGIAATLAFVALVSRYAAAETPAPDLARLEQAVTAPGWTRQAPSPDWHVDFSLPSAQVERAFARSGAPVDLSVSYYARGIKSASMLASNRYAWQSNIWHPIRHQERRMGAMKLDEYVISNGSAQRLVWMSYWIDGDFTVSTPLIRLLELRSGAIHGHSAILVLTTPVDGPEDAARARLEALLGSLGDVSAGLMRAGQAGAAANR